MQGKIINVTPYESEFAAFIRENGFTPYNRKITGKGIEWRLRAENGCTDYSAILYHEMTPSGCVYGIAKSYRASEDKFRLEWRHRPYDNLSTSYRNQKSATEMVEAANEQQEVAIANIKRRYDTLQSCGEHAYLTRKNVVAGSDIKINGDGSLWIPLHTLEGKFRGVQWIDADGNRQFVTKTDVKSGACYVCGSIDGASVIGIAEGYATSKTIETVTGIPIIAALSCNCFERMVKETIRVYPSARIIIFADVGGEETAKRLVKKYHLAGCLTPESDIDNYDWNDAVNEPDDRGIIATTELLKGVCEIMESGVSKQNRQEYALLDQLPVSTVGRIKELKERYGLGLSVGVRLFANRAAADEELLFRGLTIISARTAGGKTLGLVSMAAQILAAKAESHILFISLEEQEDRIYTRLCAAIATKMKKYNEGGLPCKVIDQLICGRCADEKDYQARFKAAAAIIESRVHIATIGSVENIGQSDVLCKLIEQHRQKYGEQAAAFVDYAQIIRPSNTIVAGWAAMKLIMDDVRKAISRSGAIVFMAAQMNRVVAGEARGDAAKEFESTQCEHLREGADLEQAAELIIYMVSDREDEHQAINVKVMKHRSGRSDLSASLPTYYDSSFVDWGRASRATLIRDTGQVTNHGTTENSRQKSGTRRSPSGMQLTCGE